MCFPPRNTIFIAHCPALYSQSESDLIGEKTPLVFLLLLLFLWEWCQREQIWDSTEERCWQCVGNQSDEERLPLWLSTAWFVFPADLRLPPTPAQLPIKVCPVWLHSVCPPFTGTHTGRNTQLQNYTNTNTVKRNTIIFPRLHCMGSSQISLLNVTPQCLILSFCLKKFQN